MEIIKIAVAEDHTLLRNTLISFVLVANNLKVVLEAENGQCLLDALQTTPVDVAILDIRMPVLDGIETLELLKIQHPEIKVIMFSSMTEQVIINRTKQLGANSFVSKSSPEILVDTIYEVYHHNFSYNSIFTNSTMT